WDVRNEGYERCDDEKSQLTAEHPDITCVQGGKGDDSGRQDEHAVVVAEHPCDYRPYAERPQSLRAGEIDVAPAQKDAQRVEQKLVEVVRTRCRKDDDQPNQKG